MSTDISVMLRTHPPSQEELDQLIQLGLLVEAATFPDLPMLQAIGSVLASPVVLQNVSAALPPTVKDARTTLETLEAALTNVLPHNNHAAEIYGIAGVATAIAMVAISLRMYVRAKVAKRLFDFDWWAVAAMIWTLITAVLYAVAINGGGCHHIWDLSFHQLQEWTLLVTIGEIAFAIALIPVKLSFLVFYYRLSPVKLYKRTLFAVGFVTIAVTAGGIFLLIFQCKPVDYWNHLLEANCIDQVKAFTVWGALTVATDVIVLLLPVKTVLDLQLKKKEKIIIIGMFSAGLLVCIASVLRVISLNKAFTHVDRTMYICDPGIWSQLELCLAVIVSSLPALKYFVTPARPDGSSKPLPDDPSRLSSLMKSNSKGGSGSRTRQLSVSATAGSKNWAAAADKAAATATTTTVMTNTRVSCAARDADMDDLELGVYRDFQVEVYAEEEEKQGGVVVETASNRSQRGLISSSSSQEK